MEEIKVSVICAAYNHEKYIRDALEGFVKQKTNFAYEVIIHDDASTDNTAAIIREYQAKYPSIIKPIFQTENQYSKKIPISATFMIPIAKGKYLAFCEGDDYWCDNTKLQKQIDFLEQNPDYVACVHNTEYYYVNINKKHIQYPNDDRDLYLRDCVMRGGQSFQTSSVVVRKDIFCSRPQFTIAIKGVGDYPLAIYYSLSGKIHYIGDVMSVYRVGHEGSWTNNVGKNPIKMAEITKSTIKMLTMADDYSQKCYHDIFNEAISFQRYYLCVLNQDYRNAIKIKGRFKKERFFKRIRYRIYALFPVTIKLKNSFFKNKDRKGKK